MINKETNTLVFPHIIVGKVLAGKTYQFNDISGGFRRLADFNLIRNKFFGGNVVQFGKIKEFGGIYLCPNYKTKNILGFYIDDPSMLTERGQEVLKEHYPDLDITFEKMAATPHRELTKDEINKKKEMIEKAKEYGVTPEKLKHSTIAELDSMLQSWESGKSGQKVLTEEAMPESDDSPVMIQHKRTARKRA